MFRYGPLRTDAQRWATSPIDVPEDLSTEPEVATQVNGVENSLSSCASESGIPGMRKVQALLRSLLPQTTKRLLEPQLLAFELPKRLAKTDLRRRMHQW